MCIDNLNDVNLRNCKEVEILGIAIERNQDIIAYYY